MRKIMVAVAILGIGFVLGAAQGDGKVRAHKPIPRQWLQQAHQQQRRAMWAASGNSTTDIAWSDGSTTVNSTASSLKMTTKLDGSVVMTLEIAGFDEMNEPVLIDVVFNGKKD